jgi:hypothetical protein
MHQYEAKFKQPLTSGVDSNIEFRPNTCTFEDETCNMKDYSRMMSTLYGPAIYVK